MKYAKLIFAATLCIIGCTRNSDNIHYTDLVDPSIGTGGHGHVFVGANVPFGMVQLGPTSIPQQWDWCSGYHISDSTVIGFSHTHLSGTGIGDLFDITVMPVIDSLKADGTSSLTYARGSEEDPTSGLWSYADRSKEISRPGYYSVPLTRYGITAELTATNRVGLHRYTFPASETAAIVLDLKNGGCWDEIERRLGYRLSFADVYHSTPAAGQDMTVALQIKNSGFAAPMNGRGFELVLVDGKGKKTVYEFNDVDPRYWFAGRTVNIEKAISIPADASGKCTLYLNLPDPKPTLHDNPRFSIRLANDGVWNDDLGYNTIMTFNL